MQITTRPKTTSLQRTSSAFLVDPLWVRQCEMASFLSFLLFFLAFFHRPLEVHWTPDRADGSNRSTWLANHLQLIVGDGVEPRDAKIYS